MKIRWLIAAVAVLFSVWLYYPGYMTYDAIDQLTQAREGVFRDWHPPLMAVLWGLLDRIVPGPALMLLWQNLMFWGGLALLSARLKVWRGIAFMLIVGLFPPILATLGAIWKDTAFASALLLATGLLSWAQQRASGRIASLALLPLFYGLALRHNAAPALIPHFLWWAWLVTHHWNAPLSRRWLNTIGLGGTVLAGMVLVVLWMNGRLSTYPTYPFQQIWVHDVVAVSLARGEVLLPPELNDPPFTMEQLRAIYTPESVVPLFCCTPEPRRIEQVRYRTRGYKVDALFARWLEVIPQNLPAYAAHRATILTSMIGWGRETVCYPLETRTDPNPLGITSTPSPFNRWLTEQVFLPLQNSLWFRVWFYWAINTLLVVGILCFRPLRRSPPMVLTFSGSLYMLPYAIAATQCDFRFSWWMMVATVTAGALYLGGRTTNSRTDTPIGRGTQDAGTATT
jgi:hypothetical protein